ncbi:MAG: 50S ribosomal protein L10 [Candidatus Gracilibacteria bacterium]|nr:50S ribosomal protein L10 [Candidatus Gracilibacteria bacterium]MDD3120415.1 50S ribosomal protein L10 [Candidatus Gracilibacteria bacterium]MDD4530519.1 50S ribosomal protein L10 [Candidatus Gracilibacteria bacterium]
MAVTRQKKEDILSKLEENFKSATSIAFTTNNKLTVEDITTIRRELLKANAKFMIAKKTLIKLAFKKVNGMDLEDSMLPNQIAILFSKGDKIAGLTILNKFVKEFKKEEKINFVGGYFDGEIMDKNKISVIADLPSKEALLARLLGSMMSPLSSLARFFDAAKTDMEAKGVTDLKALKNAKPVEPKKEEVKEIPKVEESTVVIETTTEETTETQAVETTETPAEATEETTSEVTANEITEEIVEAPEETFAEIIEEVHVEAEEVIEEKKEEQA